MVGDNNQLILAPLKKLQEDSYYEPIIIQLNTHYNAVDIESCEVEYGIAPKSDSFSATPIFHTIFKNGAFVSTLGRRMSFKLLHGVGKQTMHAGQKTLTITSTHGRASYIREVYRLFQSNESYCAAVNPITVLVSYSN